VTLFNQGRLKAAMFAPGRRHNIRIGRGLRSSAGMSRPPDLQVTSLHSGRRRAWRSVMERAGAYGQHCRDPETAPFSYRLSTTEPARLRPTVCQAR
jgi:hypothetical protein